MSEKNTDTLKITNQFRLRAGLVYDFRCEGSRLTVFITPRERPDDVGEWRVEARASHAPDALVVTEWGATRIEALREVGRAWGSKATEHGLPTFDWEAVVKALQDVRAV
jgi:hypothetical protein